LDFLIGVHDFGDGPFKHLPFVIIGHRHGFFEIIHHLLAKLGRIKISPASASAATGLCHKTVGAET
jgi:hypothetical protein